MTASFPTPHHTTSQARCGNLGVDRIAVIRRLYSSQPASRDILIRRHDCNRSASSSLLKHSQQPASCLANRLKFPFVGAVDHGSNHRSRGSQDVVTAGQE